MVLTCGHHIESVPELPLVVSDSIEGIEKTNNTIKALKQISAYPDAEKAKDNHAICLGKGKMLNRSNISRKGPLIVYGTSSDLLPNQNSTHLPYNLTKIDGELLRIFDEIA